jgi:hypothetical protein
MSPSYSAALPIAYVLLRILVVLNWFFGACILALLAYTFVNEPWTMRALEVTDYPDAQKVLMGMRAIAAIGLVSIPLNHIVLTRLLAMVGTVRIGDPFVAANAFRLRAIAWTLLALQLLGLAIAAIVRAISTTEHPVDIETGFSLNGWIAVLLTFILARVFAEGALMREDLEGTV